MALGDYFSTKAEQEVAQNEKNRETWEFENYPEGEITEMITIFQKKHGMSQEDATAVSIIWLLFLFLIMSVLVETNQLYCFHDSLCL